MESKFSFKDFENVRLKATYIMEIGGRTFLPGETIARFDNIQIAGLDEISEHVSANGGFDNRARVFWDTKREIRLSFSQGVFSKVQFALLNNSRMITLDGNEKIEISQTETKESDENGLIELKFIPSKRLFVYDEATGDKIEDFELEENKITLKEPFKTVVVDYVHDYYNGAKVYKFGQNLFNGFVELEGTTRVKDDTTGRVVTGLIKIPHLKLMSDLSIRLGAQANPIVANFVGVCEPVGSRGNTYISEFYLLGEDINSDLD